MDGESDLDHSKKVGLGTKVRVAIEKAQVTDAMVLWALSGFCIGIIILGIFVLFSENKFSDYLAYSLPCLAAVTLGGNLIKPQADRWMFVVSVILLIAGFNAYLYNYHDSWIIYFVEIIMIIAYFIGTLYHLRRHDENAKEKHRNRAAKVLFGTFILLSVLVCVVGVLSVINYYVAEHRLHVAQANLKTLDASRTMPSRKQGAR